MPLALGILSRERDLVSEELTQLSVRRKVKFLLLKVDEVLMTWIHDFGKDPTAPKTNEEALEFMTHYMAENQKHFKEVHEAKLAKIDAAN